MCDMGTCTNTAVVLIDSEEPGYDIAVCHKHIPDGATTYPMNPVF